MKKLSTKTKGWIIASILPTLISLYFLAAFICSSISVNELSSGQYTIFLNTNGVHLDIIIPIQNINPELKSGMSFKPNTRYVSYGWGDRNFYLNTPTWGDLTFSTAFNAMFLESETLMHVTFYGYQKRKWVKIKISDEQLKSLNNLINKSFHGDSKAMIQNAGYGDNDEFFEATGSYSCFYTCNTWVNSILKKSGIKACLWTPFDSALINLHKKK